MSFCVPLNLAVTPCCGSVRAPNRFKMWHTGSQSASAEMQEVWHRGSCSAEYAAHSELGDFGGFPSAEVWLRVGEERRQGANEMRQAIGPLLVADIERHMAIRGL